MIGSKSCDDRKSGSVLISLVEDSVQVIKIGLIEIVGVSEVLEVFAVIVGFGELNDSHEDYK